MWFFEEPWSFHRMEGKYDQDDSVTCWGNLSKFRVRWAEKSAGKSNYIGIMLRLKVATFNHHLFDVIVLLSILKPAWGIFHCAHNTAQEHPEFLHPLRCKPGSPLKACQSFLSLVWSTPCNNWKMFFLSLLTVKLVGRDIYLNQNQVGNRTT